MFRVMIRVYIHICIRNVLIVQGRSTTLVVVGDAVLSAVAHGQYDLRNAAANLFEPDLICPG